MVASKINLHHAQVVEEVLRICTRVSGAQVAVRFNLVDGEPVFGVESDGVTATGPNMKPLLTNEAVFSAELNAAEL